MILTKLNQIRLDQTAQNVRGDGWRVTGFGAPGARRKGRRSDLPRWCWTFLGIGGWTGGGGLWTVVAGESGVDAPALPPQSMTLSVCTDAIDYLRMPKTGHATRCPLRGQTRSQRDSVHLLRLVRMRQKANENEKIKPNQTESNRTKCDG